MTLVVAGADRDPLTDYERRALQELYEWKHPPTTWRTWAADALEDGVERLAATLAPEVVDRLVERGLPILNRVAGATASADLVVAAYRRRGHEQVRSLDDIAALSLEEVERVVGTKRFAELLKGAGEGGVTGFYGAAGAVADVPAVLGLALRSANVFAYSYGFDPTTEEGRAYALSVVAASVALGSKAKRVARAAVGVGQHVAGRELAQRLLERLPSRLIVRLTAMNASKAVPLAGAMTGATLNAWFLQNVAVQARFSYRQAFLARRHGSEVLEAYGL